MDKILSMFFEAGRWEYAIAKGVGKDVPKNVLFQLCKPEVRLKMYDAIRTGQYEIAPPHTALIPKDTPGEFRTVYVNEAADRVLLSIANDLLFELLPDRVHPRCKSYLKGVGCGRVVQEVSAAILAAKPQGTQHIGWKSDLSKYFDSVPIRFIDAAFDMVAEWEGVMGLTAKQAYRFQCETKENMPKSMELKAYKRWRGYRPKRISFANEEKRIAQKFVVIGKMSQDLSDEGMRKALSVLTAVKQLDKTVPYYYANVAEQVLRRKLWNDYGKKGGMGPMSYRERDFEYGPEIWKQVDEEYVKTLVEYFKAFMDANPAPEWVKEGCYAQFKNQENIVKKYRGKFYVEGLEVHVWSERVEWRVVIKMDRYKTEQHPVSCMEPWVEPEKPKTQKKVSPKSAPKKVAQIAQIAQKAKDAAPMTEMVVKSASQPAAPLSIADRLRAVLRARLAA